MCAGLIIASIVCVGTVLAFSLTQRPPAVDKDTLCRTDAPLEHHTVILVDATDGLSREQATTVRASIAEERSTLPTFAKFTVLLINPSTPFEPREVASFCNPGAAKSANPLFSNPDQIARVWERQFAAPIDSAVAGVLNTASASRSPILQSIAAVSWRIDFDGRILHRRLRLVSDLLQHEPGRGGFTHYQNQSGDLWAQFSRNSLAKHASADLTKAAIKIDLLRGPKTIAYQSADHRRFWERWFQEHGASSIDFSGAPSAETPVPLPVAKPNISSVRSTSPQRARLGQTR